MYFSTFVSIALAAASTTAFPTKRQACALAPNVSPSEYVENSPVRQDVTDGQRGIALTLQLTVMDASTCQPHSNGMVEVWSANAQGEYGDFLRGAFETASDGTVSFQTIFPGFSDDGANHISVAVHQSDLDSPMVYTGRLYFTDRWTEVVSMQPAYTGNTHTRVLNADDPDYQEANNGFNAVLDIESIHDDWPEGVTGTIAIGVNPNNLV